MVHLQNNNNNTSKNFSSVQEFEAVSGLGCKGIVENRMIIIGNMKWLNHQGIELTEEENNSMLSSQSNGNIVILISIDNILSGIISITDSIKPEAALTIKSLHSRGIKCFM